MAASPAEAIFFHGRVYIGDVEASSYGMKHPGIVISADDFGHSHEVNEAVVRAFQEGVLSSASLMVTGDAFDEAVELAKENPGLSIGIHLVTVMGRAVLPHHELPNITDQYGRFPDNPTAAGLRYFISRKARDQVFKELQAQFDKFLSTGLTPMHIDSHLHMHIHPVIFRAAVTLGERYGVKRMRVPVDDLAVALRFDRKDLSRKILETFIFRMLSGRMKRTLGIRGFSCCDRVYGHLLSGKMTEDYFLAVLENLGPGESEIYFHPALYPEIGSKLSSQELQGLREFKILTGKRVVRRLAELREGFFRNSPVEVHR